MTYTVGQAAKATGRSKPTISRAIKSGTISATKNANGSYTIDPAELHRVFPPVSTDTGNVTGNSIRSETRHLPRVLQGTSQREIDLLREMLADRNAVIEDLREDRDRWRTQAEKLLLTDQRPKPGEVIPMPPPTSTSPAMVTIPAAPPAHVSPPALTDSPSAAKSAITTPTPVVVKRNGSAPKKRAANDTATPVSWWRKMMGGR
jgi:excisionase family DNA binding protein